MSLKSFFFINQNLNQKIAKNTFWLFFGQIVSRLLRFFLIAYSARLLGVQDFGLFSFALSIIMIFGLFSDVGIGPLLTRELSKNENEKEKQKYFFTSFYLKLAIIALLILAAAVLAPFIPNQAATPVFYVLFLMMILNILGSIFIPISQSLEKMELEAFYSIINSLVVVACGFIFLKFYPSPIILGAAYVLGSFAALLFIVVALKKFIHWKKITFDLKTAKKIIGWAWPLALTGLTASIMGHSGSLILGWLGPIEDVGIYNAGLKISFLLFVPAGLIAAASFPALNRFLLEKSKFIEVIKQSIQTSLYLAFPLVVGGILLAKSIINLIFGAEYEAAYIVFQITLPILFAVYVTTILNNGLLARNFQKKAALFSLIAAIFNIILNYFLAKSYGFWGVAISILICEYLVFALILGFFVGKIKFWPFSKEIKKPFLAAIAMGAFILLFKNYYFNILLIIPLAALIYIITLYFLKANIFKQLASAINASE